MNGYQISADSYRKYLQENPGIDGEARESIESKIKALGFMSTATQKDIEALFDTGAFNEIVKGYYKMILDNVKMRGEPRERLVKELVYLFDTVTAEQAIEYRFAG